MSARELRHLLAFNKYPAFASLLCHFYCISNRLICNLICSNLNHTVSAFLAIDGCAAHTFKHCDVRYIFRFQTNNLVECIIVGIVS